MTLSNIGIIGIIISIIMIITGTFAAFTRYRYTYPNPRDFRLILGSTGVISAIILTVTVFVPLLTMAQNCSYLIPLSTTGNPICKTGSITINSDPILQPLLAQIGGKYTNYCHDAKITVASNSSFGALSTVEDGEVNIAASIIYNTFASYKDIVDHQFAATIYAVIVNKSVGIENVTTNQLKGIYTGKYGNWDKLGGPNLPIAVVSRTSISAARTIFDSYVLGTSETVTRPPLDTEAEVLATVQRTPGSIGYLSLSSYMAQDHSNAALIGIDGTLAKANFVQANSYKFWSIAHLYTKGQPGSLSLTQAFINYIGNDKVAQIIRSYSFLTISDIPSASLNARCFITNG